MSQTKTLKENKISVKLNIRNIEPGDMIDLFNWRNHPDIRSKFFNTNLVSWTEHERWFKKKYKDPNTTIYMIYSEKDKVGTIRFENSNNIIKISVTINRDFMGKGFGSEVIKLGLTQFMTEKNPQKPIIAEIKKDNIASIKAFQKSGFKESHLTYIFDSGESCLSKSK